MSIITMILAVLVIFFALSFILGVVLAAILGSSKKRRARAMVSLSQMTEEQITALKNIFIAYKANDIEKANRVCEEVSPEIISFLVDFFDHNNRPVEYSSGKAGKLLWKTFEGKYKKLGYSEVVSKIILGVVMDNYNEVLEKMTNKQEKAPQRPVPILGEEIVQNDLKMLEELMPGIITNDHKFKDRLNKHIHKSSTLIICGEEINPEYMPKLYSWAKDNPETLEQQLKNIAEKWHNGSIRSAMQALESDLEHG